MRQYYYKVDGCKAVSVHDRDCHCRHDEEAARLQRKADRQTNAAQALA